MLWRRSSKPSLTGSADADGAEKPSDEEVPALDPHLELESALDTIAGLLRAVGRYAFDLPEAEAKSTTEMCERWATHLLVRTPCPDGRSDGDEPHPSLVRREWGATLQYISTLRRQEQAHIAKSLHDLRQAIWAFVHGFNHALVSDGDANARVKVQLTRLQSAAQGESTDELKREALSVAATIGEIFEERQRKQMTHVAALGQQMAQLGQALEEARREVALDPLTRLYNRKTFDDQLAKVADLTSLFGQSACLLIVDVDHFKGVNDKYGHPVGDEVLRRLTGCLVRTFRRRDDVVARYGGEEFAIILRETEVKEAVFLATRLLETVRENVVEQNGQSIRVTVSVGIAEAIEGESPATWVERTDRALYEAKHNGRDRFVVDPGPERSRREPQRRSR